jgi:hypothetical protein
VTRDEIANLLDGILDKELGNLDIPLTSDWENIKKIWMSISIAI